ncbi:MAG: hypothetical protein FD153_1639 [Rhodospirillaceae bacterium]|nr:MAG: hypothetical protein FD153_1639 [Rhodospirillaceae bacterium]
MPKKKATRDVSGSHGRAAFSIRATGRLLRRLLYRVSLWNYVLMAGGVSRGIFCRQLNSWNFVHSSEYLDRYFGDIHCAADLLSIDCKVCGYGDHVSRFPIRNLALGGDSAQSWLEFESPSCTLFLRLSDRTVYQLFTELSFFCKKEPPIFHQTKEKRMTTKKCKASGKKHTPIVSAAQRRLFGAVAGGKKTKATGLTPAEAKRHLKEAAGKKLPARKKRKK